MSDNAYHVHANPAGASPLPPPDAVGYPNRDPGLDVWPGFVSPPPGYGEVAFYWWIGDKLSRERIQWQIGQLQGKGVMGLQVNYAHSDQGGFSFGHTYPSDPPLFSEDWWSLYRWFLQEAKASGMAVSLSDYTLCAPGQGWFTDEVIASNPGINGAVLTCSWQDIREGQTLQLDLPEDRVTVRAYPLHQDHLSEDGSLCLDLLAADNRLSWVSPPGNWRVAVVRAEINPHSIDPMNPLTGQKMIAAFFQRFENRNPGECGKGLNFFFSDELSFGVAGKLWNGCFAENFRLRKGYDLIPQLPALFMDIGPRTPKIRLDYSDVMVQLEEEAYFKPVFDWHQQRGMIYGCDHGGRGKDVTEFGDYFRTQRWNQGPGNDQPMLQTDIIKNKVASSIAHLYERPRTWLEGYHSSGWGTSTAQLTEATLRNFVSGHNLLTLHGLYYTTHGGWWEWAPPCNHFRMPYWRHMATFLHFSERLSYLLSQGRHQCDLAICYPVAPVEADMDGKEAVDTAFALGRLIYDRGIDFDFIDFQSLEKADVSDGVIRVAGECYRILVLPGMKAVRFAALEKARDFCRAGGQLIAVGALPEASDRAGRSDPVLDTLVEALFGRMQPSAAHRETGDDGLPTSEGIRVNTAEEAARLIEQASPRDFACLSELPSGTRPWVMHRRIGNRDIYMLLGVPQQTPCFFRARGGVELWDPWTGKARPQAVVSQDDQGTIIRTPLAACEAQLLVFDPAVPLAGQPESPASQGEQQSCASLEGDWEFELEPTLDNRWGDFRMPPSGELIGAEARVFRYRQSSEPDACFSAGSLDDEDWPEINCAYGPWFCQLGPVGSDIDLSELEPVLASLASVDPNSPVLISGKSLTWRLMSCSPRYGAEGAPGHQGYHGLKEIISDDFIVLGRSELTFTGSTCRMENGGGAYYLWSAANAAAAGEALVRSGGLLPERFWINGVAYDATTRTVPVKAGPNPVVLKYAGPGRGHFWLEKPDAPAGWQQTFPLAMHWYNKPGLLPYDIYPQAKCLSGWYRFMSAPGLAGLVIRAHGRPHSWRDGEPGHMVMEQQHSDGSASWTVSWQDTTAEPQPVAIRIDQAKGYYGGCALPDPIKQVCTAGSMPLGDWSQVDGLRSYSGSAWYTKHFVLDTVQATSKVTLNLGHVVSTAEVQVNGQPAGIKVAPPWLFDISPWVRPGNNRLRILVCNTLANHYLSVPTFYRGSLESGLIGPVSLEWNPVQPAEAEGVQ